MSAFDLSQCRILLVDDSAAFRTVLTTLLRGLGLGSVYATGDPDEAISLAHACQPDLALVDHGLAGQNGLQLIGRLRDPRWSPAPDMPLLLMAPGHLPHLVRGAQQAGATGILPKPLNATTLSACLETVMTARRSEKQVASHYH